MVKGVRKLSKVEVREKKLLARKMDEKYRLTDFEKETLKRLQEKKEKEEIKQQMGEVQKEEVVLQQQVEQEKKMTQEMQSQPAPQEEVLIIAPQPAPAQK